MHCIAPFMKLQLKALRYGSHREAREAYDARPDPLVAGRRHRHPITILVLPRHHWHLSQPHS